MLPPGIVKLQETERGEDRDKTEGLGMDNGMCGWHKTYRWFEVDFGLKAASKSAPSLLGGQDRDGSYKNPNNTGFLCSLLLKHMAVSDVIRFMTLVTKFTERL